MRLHCITTVIFLYFWLLFDKFFMIDSHLCLLYKLVVFFPPSISQIGEGEGFMEYLLTQHNQE